MIKQGRVITTDYRVVRVTPIANETEDGFHCAGIDSEGNLYVWGLLKQFLPNEQSKFILNQCWNESISDEDFLDSTLSMYS